MHVYARMYLCMRVNMLKYVWVCTGMQPVLMSFAAWLGGAVCMCVCVCIYIHVACVCTLEYV